MVGNVELTSWGSNCANEGCIVSGVHEDCFVGVPSLIEEELLVDSDRDLFWEDNDSYANHSMGGRDGQDVEVIEAEGVLRMSVPEEIIGVGTVEAEWDDDDTWVEELEDRKKDDYDAEEARKRANERKINEIYQDVGGDNGDNKDGTERFMIENRVKVARFWMTQVEVYEAKIADLKKKLDNVSDGFRAAVWDRDKWRLDCNRLVSINSRLQRENWRLTEQIGRLTEENLEKELLYEAGKREMGRDSRELRAQLSAEQSKKKELELELKITRKFLHRYTQLSWLRQNLRIVVQTVSDDADSVSCIPISEMGSGEEDEKE